MRENEYIFQQTDKSHAWIHEYSFQNCGRDKWSLISCAEKEGHQGKHDHLAKILQESVRVNKDWEKKLDNLGETKHVEHGLNRDHREERFEGLDDFQHSAKFLDVGPISAK